MLKVIDEISYLGEEAGFIRMEAVVLAWITRRGIKKAHGGCPEKTSTPWAPHANVATSRDMDRYIAMQSICYRLKKLSGVIGRVHNHNEPKARWTVN